MECGAKVELRDGGTDPTKVVASVVTMAMWASFAGLIAAVVMPNGPPVVMSLLLSCALLFLQRTVKDVPARAPKR